MKLSFPPLKLAYHPGQRGGLAAPRFGGPALPALFGLEENAPHREAAMSELLERGSGLLGGAQRTQPRAGLIPLMGVLAT